MFMSATQAAENGNFRQKNKVLCSEGKIPALIGKDVWKIPIDAQKPADGRYNQRKSLGHDRSKKKS